MKYIITRDINDDELMHWKYIKRYKKNGKWVYVYDPAGTKVTLEKIKSTVQKKASKKYYKALEKAKSKARVSTLGKSKDSINKKLNDEKIKLNLKKLKSSSKKISSNLKKQSSKNYYRTLEKAKSKSRSSLNNPLGNKRGSIAPNIRKNYSKNAEPIKRYVNMNENKKSGSDRINIGKTKVAKLLIKK